MDPYSFLGLTIPKKILCQLAPGDSHSARGSKSKCASTCECAQAMCAIHGNDPGLPDGPVPTHYLNDQKSIAAAVATACLAKTRSGAGEGNRTLVTWLGTKSSTIELHPRAAGHSTRDRSRAAISGADLPFGAPSSDDEP